MLLIINADTFVATSWRGTETIPIIETGISLIRRTGPKEFVVAIQKFAILIGFQIKSSGLYHKGIKIEGVSEKGIFDKLGLDYISPIRRGNPKLINWLYEEGHKRQKK